MRTRMARLAALFLLLVLGDLFAFGASERGGLACDGAGSLLELLTESPILFIQAGELFAELPISSNIGSGVPVVWRLR